MNNPVTEPLTEAQRFAYLKAMDVSLWILREDSVEGFSEQTPSSEASNEEVSPAERQADSQAHEAIENHPAQRSAISGSQFETGSEVDSESKRETGSQVETSADKAALEEALSSELQVEPAASSTAESIDSPLVGSNASQSADGKVIPHFVKMVPWQSGAPSNDSLLIVCRHQVDQPAQSFARPSSPSQFMMDYISALQTFRDTDDPCHVQLGHLSQAGLGKDCSPLEKVFSDYKPKVTLILGEETVKELFGDKANVADLRGKKVDLSDGRACIISYHPYSLIKNPQLKPLALDDLKLVKALLEQN